MPTIKDVFGNYTPNLQSMTIASSFTMGPNLSGSGVPTGDPGSSFATYTDTATGIEYFWNGSVWAVNAGGSGGVGLYTGSGSPEGVVTAPPGSIYTDITGGVVVAQYTKQTGVGNTGWV